MDDKTSGQTRSISAEQLARRVRAKREATGLSMRATAKELGMSAATISRVESGAHLPERDHLLRLAEWAGIDLAPNHTSMVPDVHGAHASTVEAVELHLRADENLSSEDADILVGLVRTAYNQMSQRQK